MKKRRRDIPSRTGMVESRRFMTYCNIVYSMIKKYFFKSPHPPEAVKKLLRVERTGRDIGRISGKPPSGGNLPKVLQRYIFPLTTLDEKLQ
jgi:hypothetical protein